METSLRVDSDDAISRSDSFQLHLFMFFFPSITCWSLDHSHDTLMNVFVTQCCFVVSSQREVFGIFFNCETRFMRNAKQGSTLFRNKPSRFESCSDLKLLWLSWYNSLNDMIVVQPQLQPFQRLLPSKYN